MGVYSWQVSAAYLRSATTALRTLRYDAVVRDRLKPETLAALDAPHRQAWWPGDVLVDLVTALGRERAREVGIRGSRDGMGPLVKPLASVLLALTRTPVLSLLNRLGTFVGAGVHGVDARFVPFADGTGAEVTFTFPEPVPVEMASVWAGMFDVGFSLARAGHIVEESAGATTHRFLLKW